MSKIVPVPIGHAEEMLRGSGLLFALNALVLHPYGLAIALSYPERSSVNDPPTEMILMKTEDGGPIEYEPELLAECQEKLRLFLSVPGSEKSNRDLLGSLLRRIGP